MRVLLLVAGICLLPVSVVAADQQQLSPADRIYQTAAHLMVSCAQRRQKGESMTATAQAHCVYDGFLEALQSIGYSALDLEQERVSVEFLIADRLDHKRITEAEAQVERAREGSRIVSILDSRIAGVDAAMAQQQAADAQSQQLGDIQRQIRDAQARAAERDAEISQMQRSYQTQQPYQQSAPPPDQPAFQPMPFPTITNCYSSQNWTNCISQ